MATKNTNKINLLPQEILDQRRFELWYPWIASVAIIALLLIGLLYVGSLLGIAAKNNEIAAIQADIKTTQNMATNLAQYEKEKKAYDARADIVKSALANRLDPYLCALAVTYYLPGTCSVEQMVFDASSGLTISGIVEDTGKNPSNKDWKGVAKAMDKLGESEYIRNEWLTEGSMNDAYDNYEGYNKAVSGKNQENYPDVVDQFKITGDLKLTLNAPEKGIWTKKDAETGGGN